MAPLLQKYRTPLASKLSTQTRRFSVNPHFRPIFRAIGALVQTWPPRSGVDIAPWFGKLACIPVYGGILRPNLAKILAKQEGDEPMTEETKKRPTHSAYSVRNFDKAGEQDSSWLKIGAAWQHKDGKGFDVVLEAFPVSGRVVLRLNEPKA